MFGLSFTTKVTKENKIAETVDAKVEKIFGGNAKIEDLPEDEREKALAYIEFAENINSAVEEPGSNFEPIASEEEEGSGFTTTAQHTRTKAKMAQSSTPSKNISDKNASIIKDNTDATHKKLEENLHLHDKKLINLPNHQGVGLQRGDDDSYNRVKKNY